MVILKNHARGLSYFNHSVMFHKYLICSALLLMGLHDKLVAQEASLILHHARIYTMDVAHPQAEAVAVRGDRILKVGTNAEVMQHKGTATKLIDGKGAFVMPGLIEGHGHIHGMGASLVEINLMKAANWDEILAMVKKAVASAKPGDWIVGRGWHQEKWNRKPSPSHLGYPYQASLDKVSPSNPVMLTHASGHSTYANTMAFNQAGITIATESPKGGDIVKDPSGKLVGVLEETAQGLVNRAYVKWMSLKSEAERKAEWQRSIRLAEEECLRQGITTFVDAGSSFTQIEWMRELALHDKLNIRHWMMIRAGIESLKKQANIFPVMNEGKGRLTVNAIKVSLDGALGSYGAWLLEPYTDRTGFMGQNTFSVPELKEIAGFAWERNIQLCVHAIGDRANRETVDIFAGQIQKDRKKDHRWRVEHAQHVHPSDIPRFKEWNIIASMQGIHCTSDAPYVPKRLGDARAATESYMWRSFIDAGVLVNNGTDVPVEDIDPFANLHASVTRKTATGAVFYPEQRMTRAEALRSYTLDNAKAMFQEKDKGSIEAGKLADMVIMSEDLLNCPEDRIRSARVNMTILGGTVAYRAAGF
jgi:predicted amidohydrolase YtcJ